MIRTMRYVRKHTKIPVPEIYHVSTAAESEAVGAPFVLMECMAGIHLYKFWERIDEAEKLGVVKQITGVITELATLQFEAIGDLMTMDDGKVDDNVNDSANEKFSAKGGIEIRDPESSAIPGPRHPYGSWETTEDWLLTYLKIPTTSRNYEVDLTTLREHLHDFHSTADNSLRPPFLLRHADFDGQHLLFTPPSHAKLTSVVDWDGAHIAPAYFLYEFPIFMSNDYYQKEAWSLNRTLRKEYVGDLLRKLKQIGGEDGPEVRQARDAILGRNHFLSHFETTFMLHGALENGEATNEKERKEWQELKESLTMYFVQELQTGKQDDGGPLEAYYGG
ncbi:hypothetical protein RUND412_008140 [Rhizina undulata]